VLGLTRNKTQIAVINILTYAFVLGSFQDVWLDLAGKATVYLAHNTFTDKYASSSLLWSLHDVYIENLIRFLYLPKNKICKNHMVKKRRLHCNVILNYTQICGEQIDFTTASCLNGL